MLCSDDMYSISSLQLSVFLPILATLIVAAKRTGILLAFTYISYAQWANEAYVVANAAR